MQKDPNPPQKNIYKKKIKQNKNENKYHTVWTVVTLIEKRVVKSIRQSHIYMTAHVSGLVNETSYWE